MPTADFPALEREGYAGTKLGRFEVMAKLGVGGMSEVFLAWQKAVGGFQRPVVLKRILETVKRNEEFLRMFVKEAKITSALNHQGIAHLYELVHEDDELFMVMEFVPGATLVEVARACHQAHEPIPIGFTAAVVHDTALALHYAHTFSDAAGRSKPVIHRDVAEKNIMVSLDGMVKLLDFGIARQADTPNLTQVGTVKGTAGYMSPEQVRGEKLDGRTDVFSLGVVLHECLTGQRLFRRNTLPEEVQALLEAPIDPPSRKNGDVSKQLDAVTMRALSREKGERYPTAKAMADAINHAAGDELWSQQTRAGFIQRHFEVRQQDIISMIGDPAATDLGDLLPESGTRERITRDEFRTVSARPPPPQQPLEEERTVEVRTLTARPPEPKPWREGKALTLEGRALRHSSGGDHPRKMPAPVPGYPGDEPRTVLGPPPLPDEPRTVLAPPPQMKGSNRRTEPASEAATMEARPPLEANLPSTENRAIPDEGHTVIEGDDSQRITDEAQSQRALQPGRRRLKNIAAQKQALLMWIAIGSGLVLGVVLAAFLIFG